MFDSTSQKNSQVGCSIIVDSLRTTFSRACESDPILKTLTCNKMIVFQLRDETGEWCDMEPDDKLENLIEIYVVMIPKWTMQLK